MSRIEIKRNSNSEQCACNGHSAKHRILVKGMYAIPQAEIRLCDECFKELRQKIALKND